MFVNERLNASSPAGAQFSRMDMGWREAHEQRGIILSAEKGFIAVKLTVWTTTKPDIIVA